MVFPALLPGRRPDDALQRLIALKRIKERGPSAPQALQPPAKATYALASTVGPRAASSYPGLGALGLSAAAPFRQGGPRPNLPRPVDLGGIAQPALTAAGLLARPPQEAPQPAKRPRPGRGSCSPDPGPKRAAPAASSDIAESPVLEAGQPVARAAPKQRPAVTTVSSPPAPGSYWDPVSGPRVRRPTAYFSPRPSGKVAGESVRVQSSSGVSDPSPSGSHRFKWRRQQ